VLRANERAVPGSEFVLDRRLELRAVFDELPQPELMAVVDSLAASDEGIRRILGIVSALAPIRWPAVEAIAEAHLAENFGCVPTALEVGRLDWYLAFTLEHETAVVACAFLPHDAWIPVPARLLDSLYKAQPDHPAASIYALTHGGLAAYDSTNALLRAYKAWKVDGDLARAEQIISENYASTGPVSRVVTLGSLRTELGDTEGAIAVLEAAAASYGYPGGFGGPRSLALYRLGPLYEQQGETEKARAAYAEFIERWIDADPELRPMVDTARAALARLGPMDQ
jgi:tetratricopeptide (TPR) repeat protein